MQRLYTPNPYVKILPMTKTIDQILARGVTEIIGEKELRAKLQKDPTKVVIKYGVDPTRPDIHLGHAVCLRKLREFQDLGCRVVFLIGDLTAQIGDPTGKSKIRPEIDQAEVEHNVRTYLEQAGKILLTDPAHFVWIRNSDWFVGVTDVAAPNGADFTITQANKVTGEKSEIKVSFPPNSVVAKAVVWEKTRMQAAYNKNAVKNYTFLSILAVLRKLTLARLSERDMFQERIKKNEPVFMHELLYPIIQGIDSSVLAHIFGSCDLELGGTDQHFNMLMGREVMEMNKKSPQAVLTLPLLEGIDGKEKMSKSMDNYIGITESATDIYGKTMRIPDALISRWVEFCTELPVDAFEKRLKKKENPRELKAELAQELVRIYCGEEAAAKAPMEFDRIFKSGAGGQPDQIPEIKIEEGSWNAIELLLAAKLVTSKSEARRLIEQGGVKVDEQKVSTIEASFEVGKKALLLQVGKRKWARIVS
jgi:tyrosyl-tRNA synthetase